MVDSASCTTAPGLRAGVASARGSLDLALNLPDRSVEEDGMRLRAFPGAARARIPGCRSGPDQYGRVTVPPFIISSDALINHSAKIEQGKAT